MKNISITRVGEYPLINEKTLKKINCRCSFITVKLDNPRNFCTAYTIGNNYNYVLMDTTENGFSIFVKDPSIDRKERSKIFPIGPIETIYQLQKNLISLI